MGKRIKPVNLLDGEEPSSSAENAQAVSSQLEPLAIGKLTSEQKDKLDKYDALEKTVTELVESKEVLEAKVTEYAEQLASLKSASDLVAKLRSENEQLKEDIAEAEDKAKEVRDLKKEVKALRDEADGYLLKISELTFENANLNCQLTETSKRLVELGERVNQSQFSPSKTPSPSPGKLSSPRKDAYNPYKNNGYGSW